MVTIKEVASAAGVSPGTVSNVLNKTRSVSEETAKRVMETVEKLGYMPNYAAKTLKTNRSLNIGLILPDIMNPYYPSVARGIENTVSKYGYNLFLCNKDRQETREREYIQALIEKKVDGIILFKPTILEDELANLAKMVPIVLIDAERRPQKNCAVINIDDFSAVQEIMKMYYSLGHRNIAIICGTMDTKSDFDRFSSYKAFMVEKGLSREDLIIHGTYTIESGYNCMKRLLNQPNKPTAILAASDMIAIGAMNAIQESGLKVPDDISIVGSDDINFAQFLSPPLTTVSRPKYELGETSATLLMNHLLNEESSVEKLIMMKPEIIIRNTVAKAP